MTNIVIFASGGGSNARKIMEHFKNSPVGRVALVVSNKPNAGVLAVAMEYGIPTQIIDRQGFYESEEILDVLKEHNIELVVLAGFMWLMPSYLVRAFPRHMLNIHPALLPKFGGKGMYGHHVHKAVKAAGETETGISIHFVNEHYDEGDIIFQVHCVVPPQYTAEDIARNVLVLEHHFYPEIIEKVILKE